MKRSINWTVELCLCLKLHVWLIWQSTINFDYCLQKCFFLGIISITIDWVNQSVFKESLLHKHYSPEIRSEVQRGMYQNSLTVAPLQNSTWKISHTFYIDLYWQKSMQGTIEIKINTGFIQKSWNNEKVGRNCASGMILAKDRSRFIIV